MIFALILTLLLFVSPACAGEKPKPKDPQQTKLEKVEKQIKDLLSKEKCSLDVVGVFTVNGNQFQVRVVPAKEPEKEGKGKK